MVKRVRQSMHTGMRKKKKVDMSHIIDAQRLRTASFRPSDFICGANVNIGGDRRQRFENSRHNPVKTLVILEGGGPLQKHLRDLRTFRENAPRIKLPRSKTTDKNSNSKKTSNTSSNGTTFFIFDGVSCSIRTISLDMFRRDNEVGHYNNVQVELDKITLRDFQKIIRIKSLENLTLDVKYILHDSHPSVATSPTAKNETTTTTATTMITTGVKNIKLGKLTKSNGHVFDWENVNFTGMERLECFYTSFVGMYAIRLDSGVFDNIKKLEISFLHGRKNQNVGLVNHLKTTLQSLTLTNKSWTSNDVNLVLPELKSLTMIYNSISTFSLAHLPKLEDFTIKKSSISMGAINVKVKTIAKDDAMDVTSVDNSTYVNSCKLPKLTLRLVSCRFKFKGTVWDPLVDNQGNLALGGPNLLDILRLTEVTGIGNIGDDDNKTHQRSRHMELIHGRGTNFTIEYNYPHVKNTKMKEHYINREIIRRTTVERGLISGSNLYEKVTRNLEFPILKMM